MKPGKPLERRTPLAQVSAKKTAAAQDLPPELRRKATVSLKSTYRPAVPEDVTVALAVRSGGWCELQLNGCLGRATDPCHRIGRGGGRKKGAAKQESDRLSNVLHGCRLCHGWTHARPTESCELGLMLHRGQNPAMEPVLYRNEIKYLDDFGGVHDFEDVGA
jgi:hypothetical protein